MSFPTEPSKNDDDPWLQRKLYGDEGCDGYFCFIAHEYDAIGNAWIHTNYRGKDTTMPTDQNMGACWPGQGLPCLKEDANHHEDLDIPE
jgi:hypothetical protein